MKQVKVKVIDPNGWILDGRIIKPGEVVTVSESTYKVTVETGLKLEIVNNAKEADKK